MPFTQTVSTLAPGIVLPFKSPDSCCLPSETQDYFSNSWKVARFNLTLAKWIERESDRLKLKWRDDAKSGSQGSKINLTQPLCNDNRQTKSQPVASQHAGSLKSDKYDDQNNKIYLLLVIRGKSDVDLDPNPVMAAKCPMSNTLNVYQLQGEPSLTSDLSDGQYMSFYLFLIWCNTAFYHKDAHFQLGLLWMKEMQHRATICTETWTQTHRSTQSSARLEFSWPMATRGIC